MQSMPSPTFEEAMHGVDEAQTAVKRAEQALVRIRQRLTTEPASFTPLAEATFQLRDHLVTDLGTLEARLAQDISTAKASGEAARVAPHKRDPGVSLADKVPLGGQ